MVSVLFPHAFLWLGIQNDNANLLNFNLWPNTSSASAELRILSRESTGSSHFQVWVL